MMKKAILMTLLLLPGLARAEWIYFCNRDSPEGPKVHPTELWGAKSAEVNGCRLTVRVGGDDYAEVFHLQEMRDGGLQCIYRNLGADGQGPVIREVFCVKRPAE